MLPARLFIFPEFGNYQIDRKMSICYLEAVLFKVFNKVFYNSTLNIYMA